MEIKHIVNTKYSECLICKKVLGRNNLWGHIAGKKHLKKLGLTREESCVDGKRKSFTTVNLFNGFPEKLSIVNLVGYDATITSISFMPGKVTTYHELNINNEEPQE